MFTGIIECLGKVKALEKDQENLHIVVESAISESLKIDQSVAHSGVCLTVVELLPGGHRVTAIAETLQKTNLKHWQVGTLLNMERCMPANGRLDGHIVQGHVDQVGHCVWEEEQGGSWVYRFEYDNSLGNYTVEKGSISVNGTSLTVVDSAPGAFSVAIIPYTYAHTNFHQIKVGSEVNLEFDIIGKYVKRLTEMYKA